MALSADSVKAIADTVGLAATQGTIGGIASKYLGQIISFVILGGLGTAVATHLLQAKNWVKGHPQIAGYASIVLGIALPLLAKSFPVLGNNSFVNGVNDLLSLIGLGIVTGGAGIAIQSTIKNNVQAFSGSKQVNNTQV